MNIAICQIAIDAYGNKDSTPGIQVINSDLLKNYPLIEYTELSKFRDDKDADIKIGIVSYFWRSQVVFDLIDEFNKYADLIIVYSVEALDHERGLGTGELAGVSFQEMINKYAKPNVVFYTADYVNPEYIDISGVNHYLNLHWMRDEFRLYLHDLEKKNYNISDILNPFEHKKQKFDALLGTQREHRKFIRNKIVKSKYKDQFSLGYGGIKNETNLTDEFIAWHAHIYWSPDLVHNELGCFFKDIPVTLSAIIPEQIMKDTAYTIVAESSFRNEISFFTEKTAKPLIAQRIFIMFAGQYALRNLRKLGFKTFDSIIDESYDLEENHITRWKMAWEEVEKLCQQDEVALYKKAWPILMHNKNRARELGARPYVMSQIIENHLIMLGLI
jgi:hypothetical protein